MAQVTNNNNRPWLRPLIIGGTIIIIFFLILVFGLGYGFQFYNSWLKYGQPKAEAEEKVEEKVATEEQQQQDEIEATTEEAATVKEKTTETVAKASVVPDPYESEGGLPTSDSSWSFDVQPKEIEVVTGGPGMINNVKLPGGENPDRGFVIIMLPSTETIRYEVTELWPGSNWHGAYKYGRTPTEADWRALKDNRVTAMMDPEIGNGKSGKGCSIVDVVVVQGDKVIFQETYYRQ